MDKRDTDMPVWLSVAAVGTALVSLVALERRFPLRERNRESKWTRDARNLTVAAVGLAATQVCERPVTNRLTRVVRRRRIGLLPRLNLPGWLDTVAGCLLLDLTLYHWHWLTHRVPTLWRFHRVHHADLDMDATTGVRFHAGELLISVGFRSAQIVLFGVSRRALSVWYTLLLVEVTFHHSNVGLPGRVDRWVSKLVMTPRLHGIHHSVVPDELNSNWSSGLTVWDRLHGTFRRTAARPDAEVDIGVAELRRPDQVRLPRLATMPFDNRLPPPPRD